VGRAPRSPRRYRGKDVVDWLDRMGYYAMPISDHTDPRSVRAKTNHYLTGRDGGRDIDLRQRAMEGMHLHGRLSTVSSDHIGFADDLASNLDQADAVYCRIRTSIDHWIEQEKIDAPLEPPYSPCWQPPPISEDARYLAHVINLRLQRRDACQERLECTAILGHKRERRPPPKGYNPEKSQRPLSINPRETRCAGHGRPECAEPEPTVAACAATRSSTGSMPPIC